MILYNKECVVQKKKIYTNCPRSYSEEVAQWGQEHK